MTPPSHNSLAGRLSEAEALKEGEDVIEPLAERLVGNVAAAREAVLPRRATYPEVLSEEDSLDFSSWLVPMEEMQKALVENAIRIFNIPL